MNVPKSDQYSQVNVFSFYHMIKQIIIKVSKMMSVNIVNCLYIMFWTIDRYFRSVGYKKSLCEISKAQSV